MPTCPAGIEIEIEIAVRISADGSAAHIKAPAMFLNVAEALALVAYLKAGQLGPAAARAHIAAERIENALERASNLVALVGRTA